MPKYAVCLTDNQQGARHVMVALEPERLLNVIWQFGPVEADTLPEACELARRTYDLDAWCQRADVEGTIKDDEAAKFKVEVLAPILEEDRGL